MSLDSVAEAFSAAFESPESWRNSKSSDSPTKDTVVIDETVQNLYKNLSSIAQVRIFTRTYDNLIASVTHNSIVSGI